MKFRPIVDSDIETIFRGLSHPDIIPYYGISYDSLEATKEQMEWYANEEQYWFAMVSDDGSEFYGAVGVNSVKEDQKNAEVGLWLFPDYWGKGLFLEGMNWICNYGKQELQLAQIEGFIETENTKCLKAIKKTDFQYSHNEKEFDKLKQKEVEVEVWVFK